MIDQIPAGIIHRRIDHRSYGHRIGNRISQELDVDRQPSKKLPGGPRIFDIAKLCLNLGICRCDNGNY